jgi:hypothetical protein
MARVQIRGPENAQKKVTEFYGNTFKIRGSEYEHLYNSYKSLIIS